MIVSLMGYGKEPYGCLTPVPEVVPPQVCPDPLQVQLLVKETEFPLFDTVAEKLVIVAVPPSAGKLMGRLVTVRVAPFKVP